MSTVEITAIVGNITQVDTDAIVNAANNELWMGSGVAGAIKRAGGEEIEREAVAKGPIDVGGAVATSAGNLPHKRIIHAAAMGFQRGSMIPATAGSIREATMSALRVADQEGMTSLAFPALGTGVGGFSIEECAEIMVGAVMKFFSNEKPSNLIQVVLALRDEDARHAFQQQLD